MQEVSEDDYPAVSDRSLLERIYYHHGLFCANHPGVIICICAVFVFTCSAPILIFFSLDAKIPSEWNETISAKNINENKPNWLKEKPAVYIQQIVVSVLLGKVNNSLMLPYGLHEAFHPVFEIVDFLNEYQFTESNGKRMKITDLCFLIRHYDSFLLGEEAKFLPRDGCLQISPANLWNDVASFHTDKDIVSKIYGKSRDNVSLKENIFGVPLQAIGLFPLPGSNECLVIRYAVTIVLEEFHQNFMENMKKNLHNKFPAIVEVERSSTLVHIHYEGENIIEIYHLCFVYFIVFIYLGFSLSKIEMVKSKLGLALSAVVTVVASLAMAAGLCVFFGVVPSLSSKLSEIFPYLVIIIGLENILVITRSIVSTHPCLPVPVRVAEGLSREGRSITLNLVTELLLLLFGYFTFVPVVQEFCMVGGVGVLTDFFLQIVFFATVLSIDLSRLEPSTQYMKSPHVEIDVSNSMPSTQKPSNVTEAKALPEKTAIREANNWSDVWAYLCNPKKIFSLRKDLPKRLNFAYFWARTRIAQRGIMVFAIVYFIYITSSTISFTEENSTGMKEKNSNGSHSNTHSKNVSKQELFNTSASFNKVKFLYSYVTESKEKNIKKERRNLDSCHDKFKRTGFWRNLSRQHWPEFLDLYGINLMDRYITVLPQINLQFKMNKNRLTDNTQLTDNLSKFYEDFSKDFRRSSRDHAVELAGLVKIVYLITAIVVIISVYLIYQLLSTRPRHKLRKMKPKSVMLLTSPIILDGHRQNIECLECSNGVIVSSCLEGIVRVWDAKTTECINVYERESNLSQIWALCTWECFIAVGCTNGNLEIWNISTGVNCFLYEDDSSGVTAIRYIPENRTMVVCRLNGYIEFTELGNRLLPDLSSACNKNGLFANMRKKTQSNPSSWRFIKDSVSNQQFICHFNRAHGKTVSVVEICKDLVITASFDSLLKVFRSQNGVCLFTLRGHATTVTALQTQPEIGAISGSSNGEMRMWSLISGESDRFSSKHSASIVAIVFTLSCIASLDIAEMLCIWDLNTRRCLYRWSRTHFPGGCLSLTEMSRNTIVCAGRDSLAVVELTRGQVLRVVELEQKYDHVFITRVLKCEENSVVCDYGERLVILTFYEKEDKSS